MIKKILFLEDNGSLARQTRGYLTEDGYEVVFFERIDLAQKYLEDESNEIDCIITDLNMNDEWLGPYQRETDGGLVSGWVWLRRFVYTMEKFKNIPCIIYSGYIPNLEGYLKERQEGYLLYKHPVSYVAKGGNNNNGYEALVRKLEELDSVN